ncbi:MAG: DUF2808 domain-containing protein [Prochlorococcus sp.]
MQLFFPALATALLLTPSQALAIEINGRASFVAVPTKAKLINYSSYAFAGGAKFYFVIELPQGADAGLGGISMRQIRGVQPAFYYGPIQPKAFLGVPRHFGEAVPVSASFKDGNRSIAISFGEPVAPGAKVTVVFNVRKNPPAGLYVYSMSAIPWGANPIPQSVGVVQMSIFSRRPF